LALVEIPWLFLSARFVVGTGVGMITLSLPMYTSEVTPPTIRGMLGFLFQLMAFVGVLIAGILNVFEWMDYRQSLFLPGWPGIVLAAGIFYLPISPRFALMKWHRLGNEEEGARRALASLQKLRSSRADAAAELVSLRDSLAPVEAMAPWGLLWRDRSIRRRIVISCILQFLQQFTGINVIVGYGAATFNSLQASMLSLVMAQRRSTVLVCLSLVCCAMS